MNKQFANLLDNYLTKKLQDKKLHGYFINIMTNNEKAGNQFDIKNVDILNRRTHNHANITVINYFDMGNNFKDWDPREWYYVICKTDMDFTVTIRQDLIDSWKESNAKDNVIIINDKGMVWDLPMSYFFNGGKNCWNDQGNINRTFVLGNPTFEADPETTVNADKVAIICRGWGFLGHTAYAKHRTGPQSKTLLVARYDNNGKYKTQHNMKSTGQVYDILGMENYGSLRTFQRKLKANNNEMFLTNKDGITFWVTDRLWATAPETVENTETETETVDTTDLATMALEIAEPKSFIKVETKVLETKVMKREPMVAKSIVTYGRLPNSYTQKPKRIINR